MKAEGVISESVSSLIGFEAYTVPCEKFAFDISDKGGLGETRYTDLDVNEHKNKILEYKDRLFNIQNNEIILL